MEDGTLLSSERPALALDSTILYRAVRGAAMVDEHTTQTTSGGDSDGAVVACKWGDAMPKMFLRDLAVGQPPATKKSLAAAQAWCCAHPTTCGGVTFQSGQYTARQGSWPQLCDDKCGNMSSWPNPSFAPPPAPPLERVAPNGEIWSTFSTVGNELHQARHTYRHVLVPLLRQEYGLTIRELSQNDHDETGGVEAGPQVWVTVENAGQARPTAAIVTHLANSSSPLLQIPTCDRADFKLYHLSPVLRNGWALVGETAKWIPISTARIRSISTATAAAAATTDPSAVTDSSTAAAAGAAAGAAPVTVQLSGVDKEEITFGFVDTAGTAVTSSADAAGAAGASEVKISYVTCVFGAEGTLTMTPGGCVNGPW
jgi:hypothetical protein